MQQKRSLRKRVEPAPAGEGSPATHFSRSPLPALPPAFPERIRARTRRTAFLLLVLGLCLELCYLALYGALAGADPLSQAWQRCFPMLGQIYELAGRPVSYLTWQPWLRIGNTAGGANVTLLLLGSGMLLVFLAAWLGRGVGKKEQSIGGRRLFFWIVLGLTALFALTFCGSPMMLNAWTRDPLQSWLLGRLVISHHVNPYTVVPASFPQDAALLLLQQSGGAGSLRTYGPVWADVSILITQIAPDHTIAVLLGFRLLELCALLVSAWLIWALLARLQPQWRICGTLLFAWNPLVLLLAVGEEHHEMLVVMMVLLAIFFLSRNAPLLGWCIILLAVLVDLSLLLVLPLFLHLLERETRFMNIGGFWRVGNGTGKA